MAKSADEIERELEAKRQQLHSRVDHLRERVAGDVRGMRDETQDQLKGYLHTAEAQVSEHPWLAVAGGFGSGVALGVTTPSLGGGSGKHSSPSSGHASNSGGEGLLSRGLNTVVAATGGPVFDEVRSTLQDSLSEIQTSLKETVSELVHSFTGNGASPQASDGTAMNRGTQVNNRVA